MPSGSLPFLLLLLLLFLDPMSSEDTATTTKSPQELAEFDAVIAKFLPVSFASVICVVLNLASVVILFKARQEARRTPEFMDKYRLSMHWLSRTAIRQSIGPNAKKILVEYVETMEKEKKKAEKEERDKKEKTKEEKDEKDKKEKEKEKSK